MDCLLVHYLFGGKFGGKFSKSTNIVTILQHSRRPCTGIFAPLVAVSDYCILFTSTTLEENRQHNCCKRSLYKHLHLRLQVCALALPPILAQELSVPIEGAQTPIVYHKP
jgi:hypothetical protein